MVREGEEGKEDEREGMAVVGKRGKGREKIRKRRGKKRRRK